MRYMLGLSLIFGMIALLVLVPGQEPIAGFERDMLARGAFSITATLLVSGWVVRTYRGRLSKAFEAIAAWLMIILVLVAGYAYRFELGDFGNRILGGIAPGLAVGGRSGEVIITHSIDGTFPVSGQINGVSAELLFDTGASSVVIRYEDAARFGITLAGLDFNVPVSTANGPTQSAPVTLDSLSVGSIRLMKIRALVSQAGNLKQNLLGHSFLSRLSSYTVEGDRLILRGPKVRTSE